MSITNDRYEHARQNAKAWAQEIIELHHKFLANVDGDGDTAEYEAIDRKCEEMPLSVQVRTGWFGPGAPAEDRKPGEYEILLTTGGPALRVRGTLDQYGEPDNYALEMQDWGVPWREWFPEGDVAEFCDVLGWFAGHFYYGE